jgi:hypothetical protein|tara:strand:+ start:118 stop:540 length:423 start_codon:yes stop_codon:yes gene_type:complete
MRKTIIDTKLQHKIIKLINDTFKIDIVNKTRKQEYVFGRMIYYKILRELGYGFMPIGKTLGKDHSTIIHSIRAFDDITVYDKELYNTYKVIKDMIFEGIQDPVTQEDTYPQLIRKLIHLERENKRLNLYIEDLEHKYLNA